MSAATKRGIGISGLTSVRKFIDYASAANAISAEFDKPVRRSLGARGFDVDDDEIQVLEQSRMAIVRKQFDGVVVDDLEAAIVSDEIGYE